MMSTSVIRQLASRRGYSTAANTSFREIYENLDTRMARSRLNTTNQNLVYRPKREKDLTSRKEPIVIDGVKLVPQRWQGIPGKKDLLSCIRKISSQDNFRDVKYLIKDYAKYYPTNLETQHFVRLIRQAAKLGLYNEAVTLANSPELQKFLGEAFRKEQLRIHALRLKSTSGGAIKLKGLNKLFSTKDLETVLLRTVALSNISLAGEQDAAVSEALASALAEASGLLQTVDPDAEVSQRNRTELPSFYINLRLASDVIKQNEPAGGVIRKMLGLAEKRLPKTDFVEQYVADLDAGFSTELSSQKNSAGDGEGEGAEVQGETNNS